MHHTQCPLHQVSKTIAQLCVVAIDESLFIKVSVAPHHDIAHHVIAKRRGAIAICQQFWINNIAKTFTHLFSTRIPKSMDEQLWHLIISKSHRMEHARPINSMCWRHDIFSNQVMIARPILGKMSLLGFIFRTVASKTDIVDKSIKPNIGDKIGIKGKFNSPRQATLRPRNTKVSCNFGCSILQFIPSKFRNDKARMLF